MVNRDPRRIFSVTLQQKGNGHNGSEKKGVFHASGSSRWPSYPMTGIRRVPVFWG